MIPDNVFVLPTIIKNKQLLVVKSMRSGQTAGFESYFSLTSSLTLSESFHFSVPHSTHLKMGVIMTLSHTIDVSIKLVNIYKELASIYV